MFRNNIHRRVMEHAKNKAVEGQKEYDQFADSENDALLDNIKSLQESHRRNKQNMEEEIVKRIII